MKEILYLQQAMDRIVCINYFGKKLEHTKKYIVKNFSIKQKVIDMSLDGKKMYILLENGTLLILKDFSILKNDMFKDLIYSLRLAYLKRKFKQISNNTKYVLQKNIKSKKIPIIGLSLIILFLSKIPITEAKSKYYKYESNQTEEIVLNNDSISNNELNSKINSIPNSELNSEVNSIPNSELNSKVNSIPNNELNSKLDSISEINSNFENIISTSIISNDNYNITNINGDTLDNNIALNESTIDISYDNISLIFKDGKTTVEQIVDPHNFYSGYVYEYYEDLMSNSDKTAELNNIIQQYVEDNLLNKMWGNAEGQNFDNYVIPEKYKNGVFTLDELFTDASNTFGVPKDILVANSEHECAQGYYVRNSYTGIYEKNLGGMMGYLDINDLDSNHLPGGDYGGFDVLTNPAISIYSYASTVRFFYESFKNIDVGYGLDPWDISYYMIAIGQGYVTDPDVGFKYRHDFYLSGISQLNINVPEYKALREAYLNNTLGVNDIIFKAEDGVITHWDDEDKFYYKNGEYSFDKNQTTTFNKIY